MKKIQESIMDDYAQTLDLQVRGLWPKGFAERLSDLLQSYKISNILDCSGGTGFPVIELKTYGWEITYSDGSSEMFEFFNEKASEHGLEIPSYLSLWQDMDSKVPGTYDAVLCRGNSLLGISSYNKEKVLSRDFTLNVIQTALNQMFHKVKEGGLLYIDLPKPEQARPEKPYQCEITPNIATTISYDPITKLRTTKDVRTDSNGEQTITYHTAYPIYAEELLEMLRIAGFERIESSPIEEAFYIDAYVAFK
ncbi:class I SAM-dependent methyltransferase [Leucothrix sargassi]|nr:class I SAM-dependent methyltransferase [Leucothrix sargassi]